VSEEFPRGVGRISGAISLALASLSLLAVFCFRYPEILTTPDLRAVYPVDELRVVLFLAIAVSLGAGLWSFLSGARALGLGGCAVAALAIALGGAWVETAEDIESRRTLGLDWFVLDLLVLALIFVPLERLFALRPTQRLLRRGFRTDLIYFFVSHMAVQATVLLTLAPAALLLRWAVDADFQAAVANQPLALQLLEAVLLADGFQYGVHRLSWSTFSSPAP
jgi:lathosterol oxidase